MRTRFMAMTIVVGIGLAAAVGTEQQRLSAQDPIRKQPACTVFCGDGTFNSIGYARPPKCWGGPLPASEAANNFNNFSPADQALICGEMASAPPSKRSCPAFKTIAALCNERSPGCEKSPPWFDNSPAPSNACKDFEPWKAVRRDGAIFLEICAIPVFAFTPPSGLTESALSAYESVLLGRVRNAVGYLVCCDKLRDAARPGSPCDPRFDLDCDGILNPSDRTEDMGDFNFPSIDLWDVAPGTPVGQSDPFPPWVLDDMKSFVPPASKCDCKWQLMKGTRTCSPDGRQPHSYQARWRCPSSGNERFTRKEAPASAPCTPRER